METRGKKPTTVAATKLHSWMLLVVLFKKPSTSHSPFQRQSAKDVFS